MEHRKRRAQVSVRLAQCHLGLPGQNVGDGSLFRDTYVTGIETLLGFVLGNLIGTLCGLGLWYSRFLSLVMQPFVIAIGAIPIIALAPIVIIWFGTGIASKVAMATLSVVVVAFLTSYKGRQASTMTRST